MKIITNQNDGGETLAISVHGLGLTGVERAWVEFGGDAKNNPYEAKYSPQNAPSVPEFEKWLAAIGCELGVVRNGAYFRIVKTSMVGTQKLSRKLPHYRLKNGRAVCYGLPDDAYPFDRI